MLILVAVTVKTAVNSGLFGHAKNAVQQWGDAERDELQLGDNIDEILDQYKTKEHNWQRNGDNIKCDHCGLEFVIGDYLDYKPDVTSKTVTITAEESGLTSTVSNLKNGNSIKVAALSKETDEGIKVALIDSGESSSSNQVITQEAGTYWRVMGVEDSDGNGTNETLLIKMANPTEQTLYLKGAAAYNNGPDLMNRIAKELYSSSKYGEARSMNINDVNNTLQYTPRGGMYYENSKYNELSGFNTELKDIPTWDAIKANGTYTPDGTNTETKLGSYKVDGYYYMVAGSETEPVVQNPATGATTAITTNTLSTIFMDISGNSVIQWLACRGVSANDDYAIFGPGAVGDGEAYSCGALFNSYGNEVALAFGVCPVVSLKSEIPAKIAAPEIPNEPK